MTAHRAFIFMYLFNTWKTERMSAIRNRQFFRWNSFKTNRAFMFCFCLWIKFLNKFKFIINIWFFYMNSFFFNNCFKLFVSYFKIINWLIVTVLLGVAFLFCQAYEYYEAYAHYGLTLDSGIFGSTFFMLTGFHGAHVTIGTIMLLVMLGRARKGHFTATDCFGFEAAAWYWHFVDVVWVLLFIFVYILGT